MRSRVYLANKLNFVLKTDLVSNFWSDLTKSFTAFLITFSVYDLNKIQSQGNNISYYTKTLWSQNKETWCYACEIKDQHRWGGGMRRFTEFIVSSLDYQVISWWKNYLDEYFQLLRIRLWPFQRDFNKPTLLKVSICIY